MRFLSRAAALSLLCICILLQAPPARGAALGDIRGVVHDPHHRPIAGASIEITSSGSDFHLARTSNASGEFEATAVPLGEYRITVTAPGFTPRQVRILLSTGEAPVLHFEMGIASAQQEVRVTAAAGQEQAMSAPISQTTISRRQIDQYAGVDQTNSLRMITGFVPGATVVHDQLHVRGGHQVTWAIDGVPLPNTNIATNVGPQFDPKDVDYLEASTGGYSASYGDRTYGVFNVAPRTGFERDRQGELVASYGNYHATDDQLSFGDHSERFAWYVSANGNRTDFGLEPPTALNLHNLGDGGGSFTSLIFNRTANDQFRFDGAFRADYYQIPNTPDQQAFGVRDREREQDGFGILSYVHTFDSGTLVTISPFYHFNRAAYVGGPEDVPSTTDNRASSYEGGQAEFSRVKGASNFRAGLYSFAQQDTTVFSLSANDGSGLSFHQEEQPRGSVVAPFVEEQWQLRPWWMLSGGLRYTHFSGAFDEDATDPRLATALTLPRLGWVVRAAYSRFYQAPPLDTISGAVLQYALRSRLGFLPLRGERDEQHEFGILIPFRGWSANFDYFRTGARNFFDHDAIGNSDIFLPLTIDHARINGWEANVQSPRFFRDAHAHVVYSNQQAEGFGAVTGGLTDFSPPPSGGFYLDHDQRNTLSSGLDTALPRRAWASFDVNYGSGFLNGNGPAHLPGYTTLDLSLGKRFGENLTVNLSATNLTNTIYQLDDSNTFGGTHFADPRILYGEVRYRFHF
jgi:outer membrane receptor protein involved in Fe transport